MVEGSTSLILCLPLLWFFIQWPGIAETGCCLPNVPCRFNIVSLQKYLLFRPPRMPFLFLKTWKTPIYPFTFQVCFSPEVLFHPRIQTSSPVLPLSESVNHCWATFQPGKCFYHYPCTDLFTWLSTSEELGSCLLHSYL